MPGIPLRARRWAAPAAALALWLVAGCAGGGGPTPTPIPASIVRPDQPTPVYSNARPQFRMDQATRPPVFVPTPNPAATAAALVTPRPQTNARRALLQALLMDQPPSAMGIAPGGAAILDAPGGAAVGSVPAAGGVTVTGRSADGAWLAVYDNQAVTGWVAAGALQLFGADDLTVVDTAFSPGPVATLIAEAMLPVTTPIADLLAALPAQQADNAARATAIAQGGSAAFVGRATPTPATQTAQSSGSAPAAEAPAARDAGQSGAIQVGLVNSSGNLNLRGAPSTDGTVLASLPPQSQLIVLGRTDAGDWLRVRTPAGDGWVDARFVDLTGAIETLPVANN